MTELQTNTRNHVVDTLQVFASSDRQRRYKDAVTFVHIPQELLAQWGSYRELRSSEWYIKIWDELELENLDNFDFKLRQVLKDLGENIADVPEILENQTWIEIMKGADECLKSLNRNCV